MRFRVRGFGYAVSGTGFRAWVFEVWGCRVGGFGFGVTRFVNLEFRVQGFLLSVRGFEDGEHGSGCRVRGIALRV